MFLKVIAEGPCGYVSNGFNVFDGIIVILRYIIHSSLVLFRNNNNNNNVHQYSNKINRTLCRLVAKITMNKSNSLSQKKCNDNNSNNVTDRFQCSPYLPVRMMTFIHSSKTRSRRDEPRRLKLLFCLSIIFIRFFLFPCHCIQYFSFICTMYVLYKFQIIRCTDGSIQ